MGNLGHFGDCFELDMQRLLFCPQYWHVCVCLCVCVCVCACAYMHLPLRLILNTHMK